MPKAELLLLVGEIQQGQAALDSIQQTYEIGV